MLEKIRLTIDSIAAGGDGVGRTDNGMAVFVPRTAPGDEVETSLIKKQKRFARGFLDHIVTPSKDRTQPVCEHYVKDHCGGCQIQHMRYDSQLAAKERIIRDALRRIGKREIQEITVKGSTLEWRYRTRLTLAMREAGRSWIAGLHPYDAPGDIFDLVDCPITDSRVVNVWNRIMSAADCFPDVRKLRGSVRWTGEGATFVLSGGKSWSKHAYNAFMDAVPELVALYWHPEGGNRTLLVDKRMENSPAASFAQVNPEVAAGLKEYVRSIVTSYKPSTVVEGYSGNGDLAVSLTEEGITVRAIELDVDSAQWASHRLEAPSVAIQGRVETELAACLPADVVVLNPPRAGLHEDIPRIIEEQSNKPRAIVYISCDPATLARDLSRFTTYKIHSVTAFDMFPQTSHVETVCELISAEKSEPLPSGIVS